MKKFTLKAITLATASVCGSAAFAGAITAPTVVNYAIEALAAPTAEDMVTRGGLLPWQADLLAAS